MCCCIDGVVHMVLFIWCKCDVVDVLLCTHEYKHDVVYMLLYIGSCIYDAVCVVVRMMLYMW